MHLLAQQPLVSGLNTYHAGPTRALAPSLVRSLRVPQKQQGQRIVVAEGIARDILAREEVEGDVLSFLDVSEKYLKAVRSQKHEPNKKGPTVVKYGEGPLPRGPAEYDVTICGGTLGLFLAVSLQLRGFKVAIVEKRLVQGRNQEWNISRGELQVLLDLGLMTEAELESAIVSEFNPIRVGFHGGEDIWVRDCLNLGVHPRTLLDTLRRKFILAGGGLFENTAFKGAVIHENGVELKLAPGGRDAAVSVGDTNRPNGLETAPPRGGRPGAPPPFLSSRLLLDCMGHYSDIVKQIRGRVRPDGMCMVVGSCAEGFPPETNTNADLLYSLSHARRDMQLFWEAFPAEGGDARTTYMFAYTDAHPSRPGFEELLDTYFSMLPQYQGMEVEELRFKRVLFGGFPCYNNGPLPPAFDRVMQIGDASASQSPLSFGGFGCMMRHLPRLTRGLAQALAEERLQRGDLAWLQPYQPSLAASWLFQRSMSFGVGHARYPSPEEASLAGVRRSPGTSSMGSRDEWGWGRADPSRAPRLSPLAMPYVAPQLAAASSPDATATYPSLLGVMAACRPLANQYAPYTPVPQGRQFGAGAADPDDYLLTWGEGLSVAGTDTATVLAHAATTSATPREVDLALSAAPAAAADATALQRRDASADAGVSARSASSSSSATRSVAASVSSFEADYSDLPAWLKLPHSHVNDILGTNFRVMRVLGDRILRPFLQDTIQLVPLTLSMTGMLLANPVVISRVFIQVGPRTLASWFLHYFALAGYTLAHYALRPLRGVIPAFAFQRLLDALEYGSGMDHVYHPPSEPSQPVLQALQAQQQQLLLQAQQPQGVLASTPPQPVSARS